MSGVDCLIRSNADIAGVGVRIAVYVQNILCFFPALWAIADEKITEYELDSMENMSTTNLVVAFGILISCFIQAPTLGLTNFHTSIVLSMSWMNNTNVFIYFLLYAARLKRHDGNWVIHLKNHVISTLHLRRSFPPQARPADEEGTHEKEQVAAPAAPMKIRLFRRVALVLGSLHLTLMSALGIWLWSDPRGFGTTDSGCAVDHAHLAIAGVSVPFSSHALRTFSLFIYGLFLIPGVNPLLPAAVFLSIYLLHGKRYPETKAEGATQPLGKRNTFNASLKHVWSILKHISSPKSPVFPAFVGLCFLLAIDVIFIVDIELTLRNNQEIQESGEAEWGFGQVLAVLLLILPLRDLVEMVFRRRQEFQTHLDNQLKRAIVDQDVKEIEKWVSAGANPNTKADDSLTAMEVADCVSDWECIRTLAGSGADIAVPFGDGPTAECVRILGKVPGADINAVCKDGQSALEVATRGSDMTGLIALLRLGADVNTVFSDNNTALQVASLAQNRRISHFLVANGADASAIVHAAARVRDWDLLRFLVAMGVGVNTVFPDSETTLEVAIRTKDWEGACILGKLGAKLSPLVKDTLGQAALKTAVRAQEWKEARALAVLGWNVNIVIEDGQLELDAAIQEKDWKRVRFLIGLKADGNLVFQDGSESMVLKIAAQEKQWDLVLEIIDAGADVNMAVTDDRDTVLHLACISECQPAVIEQLLKKGADANAKGWSKTVLHQACLHGRDRFVLLLLAHGADPRLKDNGGDTPLHDACHKGHEKCAELLLKHQAKPADPNPKNIFGKTPLHNAYWGGKQGCIKLLLENGADETIKDDIGRTPREYPLRQ